MAGDRARLRDHPQLVALSVGLAVVETVVVWIAAPHSGLALAPQVSAPAPYDVFHDLRWLLVYHRSWLGFFAEALLFFVFRTAVTACSVRFAWPADVEPLTTRDLVRRSAASTGILALVLLPFAVLLFATAVFSLSWLFFVGVPVLVMLAVLMHQATVTRRWWHERPALASVVPVLASFAVLTVAGAVLAVAPAVTWVPVAALAGLANAWCWLRIVQAIAGRAPHAAPAPVRPRRPRCGARARARRHRDRVRGLDRAGVVAGPDPGRGARPPGHRCWW